MLIKNKKAQSVLEYAMILVIVMGAFIAIGNYMKRGIQGRWRAVTDDLGDQYDPRVADSMVEYKQVINALTSIQSIPTATGAITHREDYSTVVETKNGYISVGSY